MKTKQKNTEKQGKKLSILYVQFFNITTSIGKKNYYKSGAEIYSSARRIFGGYTNFGP